MIALGRELERVVTVTPFGFGLWDLVDRRRVRDDLVVVGRGPGTLSRPASAGPNGIFAIHHRPSAGGFASGVGDDAFWASPPSDVGRWRVEVTDAARRFLPFAFAIDGAVRVGLVAREVCGIGVAGASSSVAGLHTVASPPGATMPVLPLFPAPSRAVPSGVAPISAQLETRDARPVAGALVRVTLPGPTYAFGMSDATGSVLVLAPYPELDEAHLSPPSGNPKPVREQTWPVTAEVFWDPSLAAPDRPDLCEVLDQLDRPPQPLVGQASPGTAVQTTLRYGTALVLTTPGQSELVLDAASSP